MNYDQRTQEMTQMYEAGSTLQQVGDKYGVTRERVRQLLEEVGVERRSSASRVYARDTAIVAAYQQGLSAPQVAKQMGTSNFTVYRALRRQGCKALTRRHDVIDDRFWSKVDKSGECWLWLGKLSNGHGRYALRGTMRNAHTITLESVGRTKPSGKIWRSICKTKGCVKPDHWR